MDAKLTEAAKYIPVGTTIHISTYADGNTCLQAVDDEGFPAGILSVNLPETNINANHVWIKSWSENEGVLTALVESGLVKPLGITQPTGFCAAALVELTYNSFS